MAFLALEVFSPGRVIYSHYSDAPVQIDGNLSDWYNGDCLILTGEWENSENQVFIRSCWDENELYLSYDVRDSDVRAYQAAQDHPELFLDDMVEVLFDPWNLKDSCWSQDKIVYHVNALGSKKDDRGKRNCSTDPYWNGRRKGLVFG